MQLYTFWKRLWQHTCQKSHRFDIRVKEFRFVSIQGDKKPSKGCEQGERGPECHVRPNVPENRNNMFPRSGANPIKELILKV
jgi:hypothetical protein